MFVETHPARCQTPTGSGHVGESRPGAGRGYRGRAIWDISLSTVPEAFTWAEAVRWKEGGFTFLSQCRRPRAPFGHPA